MTSIAVLGTGRMGTALATRLLATGHRVTVWNRTPARTRAAAAAGASVASSLADVDAGVVITMLTDAAAVHDVLAGLRPRPGTVLVEMSTIGPDAVRALEPPAGVTIVDAPVVGSVAAAATGALTLLTGGDVARVRPVLEALGTVHECGPLGSGAALKLVANTALVTGIAALADTVAVARALGVDDGAALTLLANGPLAGAARRAGAAGADFPIALAAKDLDLVRRIASPPMVDAAAAVLRASADPTADLGTVVPGALARR
ncbi:NAD(P)-dependent oxidoreductase [Actinoplanes sp. NPDC051494]|uniref:NAD(P)-dependent oxidoreductase n=1 Tax=Actinoplanes sp. NPDC051494 TaxID=3363907 RepID=UPI0037BD8A77